MKSGAAGDNVETQPLESPLASFAGQRLSQQTEQTASSEKTVENGDALKRSLQATFDSVGVDPYLVETGISVGEVQNGEDVPCPEPEKSSDDTAKELEKNHGEMEAEEETNPDEMEDFDTLRLLQVLGAENIPPEMEAEEEKNPDEMEGHEEEKNPDEMGGAQEKNPDEMEGEEEKNLHEMEGEEEKNPDEMEGHEEEKNPDEMGGAQEKNPDEMEGEEKKNPIVEAPHREDAEIPKEEVVEIEEGKSDTEVDPDDPPIVKRTEQWKLKPTTKSKAAKKDAAVAKAKAKGKSRKQKKNTVGKDEIINVDEEEEASKSSKGRKRKAAGSGNDNEKKEKEKGDQSISWGPVSKDGASEFLKNCTFPAPVKDEDLNSDDVKNAENEDKTGETKGHDAEEYTKSFARRFCPKTSPAREKWIAIRDCFNKELRGYIVDDLGAPAHPVEDWGQLI